MLLSSLQVRFHPRHSEIVASGSLDHEVRLWNAKTGECIRTHDFCKRQAIFFCLFPLLLFHIINSVPLPPSLNRSTYCFHCFPRWRWITCCCIWS